MQKRIRSILSTTRIAFGIATTSVMAQQAPAETAVPNNAASAQTYTDTQLQNFISASQKVAVISQDYTPRIESTTDQNEREQIFREADDKMVAAVEDEGLSVQEFNSINQQLPQDPQLEQRVNSLLQ